MRLPQGQGPSPSPQGQESWGISASLHGALGDGPLEQAPAELRTEPVFLSQATGNFGHSNHTHQSLYQSTWHDGGLGLL